MLSVASAALDGQDQPIDRLRALIRERSVLRDGPYKLASGGTSDTFFDMKQSLLDPRGLDLTGDVILNEIRDDEVEAVGGLVIGACPIADVVALKSLRLTRPLTAFYVRKDRKTTGTQSLIEGPLKRGSRVVMVDDVTTQGGSVLKAINAVRDEFDCQVERVIAIVDREMGAAGHLAAEGIELTPLFTMSEFM